MLNTLSIPLADGGTQEFTMSVSDGGRVNDLNVTVDMRHTRTSELDVWLEAPDGTTVELFSGVGGDSDHFTATTLDDEALQPITSGAGPFMGRFQAEGKLADFRGKDITGTWRLRITDHEKNSDHGALIGWSLEINPASEPAGDVNYDGRVNAKDIDLSGYRSTDLMECL